jgi:hypothetical protein
MRELRGAAIFRGEAGTISTMEDLRRLCRRVIRRQEEE